MKLVALIASVLILFTLVRLSRCDQQVSYRTRLKVLQPNDTLDPMSLNFIPEYRYIDNLGIRLFQLNHRGEYEGMLTKEFTLSKDKKILRIKLHLTTFSDGSPITAKDVIRSLKRTILFGAAHSNPRQYIKGAEKAIDLEDDIEGLEEIGKRELAIHLNHPTKEIFYFFQLADFTILTPNQVIKEKLTVSDWINDSSGPYTLALDQDKKIFFKANANSLNYDRRMPQTIYPIDFQSSSEVYEAATSEIIHFGDFNLKEMVEYGEQLRKSNNLEIFSSGKDGIVYLILNLKNSKFADQKKRQLIYKELINNFKVTGEMAPYTTKAIQFFLPEARGYIENDSVISLVNNFRTSNTTFQEPIFIRTTNGMKNYLPSNFDSEISKILGVEVKTNFEDFRGNKYFNLIKNRDFEGHLMATSMSFKVLGESLNLQYLGDHPTLLDPSGMIKGKLDLYQKEDSPELEAVYIREIMKQMASDAELIPLFYFSKGKFVNSKYFDTQYMNLLESFQFWRLRVK